MQHTVLPSRHIQTILHFVPKATLLEKPRTACNLQQKEPWLWSETDFGQCSGSCSYQLCGLYKDPSFFEPQIP